MLAIVTANVDFGLSDGDSSEDDDAGTYCCRGKSGFATKVFFFKHLLEKIFLDLEVGTRAVLETYLICIRMKCSK